VALSFAVILVTLVLQGLTLPGVIRVLHLESEDADLREEREVLIAASRAALGRLKEIEETVVIHPQLLERVRAPYEERLARLTAEERQDPECKLTEGEASAFRRLLGDALSAERQAAVALRNEGKINEEVPQSVQEALDLEALQPDR
jgi:CPA1 family monovalent cation:H+ antiporter